VKVQWTFAIGEFSIGEIPVILMKRYMEGFMRIINQSKVHERLYGRLYEDL